MCACEATAVKTLYSGHLGSRRVSRVREVNGINRSLSIHKQHLGPNKMVALASVADIQRLRLERFVPIQTVHMCGVNNVL